MGFPTRKKLDRHFRWHHQTTIEAEESLHFDPNPLNAGEEEVDWETRRKLLSEFRKKSGIVVKRKKIKKI